MIPKRCSINTTNEDIRGKAIVPANPPVLKEGAIKRTGYLAGASKARAALARETKAGPKGEVSVVSSVCVMRAFSKAHLYFYG